MAFETSGGTVAFETSSETVAFETSGTAAFKTSGGTGMGEQHRGVSADIIAAQTQSAVIAGELGTGEDETRCSAK
jgi:hypothetical protein